MAYWLMKSEPDTYSILDLERQTDCLWEGVRNYQARNYMIKDMNVGDNILFYHSNCKSPGVIGLAQVSAAAEADPTQFDPKSTYYDPKSTKANPRWRCVKIKYSIKLLRLVSLAQIKSDPALKDMVLLHNSRLSIQPVTKAEYLRILKLSQE